MAHREEGQNLERLFTLTEANGLIPQLEEHLTVVKRGKGVLVQAMAEIKKASEKASLGGGSAAGRPYVRALEQISRNLHLIHEMGVLVKDVDMGLCDFPHLHEGRIVYLCWKLGETEIGWWHEVQSGFSGRQSLEDLGHS
ncbi:MAG: DUF2203 domain-containing protein [Nitrospiraceae bacterium]